MTALCDAWDAGYPSAHVCDDPLSCALESLVDGEDPRASELDRLHGLLDRIEELAGNSTAGVAKTMRAWIHAERGGPR